MALSTKSKKSMVSKKSSNRSGRASKNSVLAKALLFRQKRFIFGLFLLAFASIGTYLLLGSNATSNFVLVGTHPQASLQSTTDGKRLRTLNAWNGKIYSGYGDINANTGPIAITPFDPVTNSFASSPALNLADHGVQLFYKFSDKFYAGASNGYGADYGVANLSNGQEMWTSNRPVHATHNFGMATLTGNDLWIVGSGGNDAVAWRSVDGGASWQEALRVRPVDTSQASNFARFYFAGVYNNKLYVQAVDSLGGVQSKSRVFDGAGWSNGPNLLPVGYGFHTEVFAGKMINQSRIPLSTVAQLLAFDGNQVNTAFNGYLFNYTIDGNYLYVLATDGKIYRTQDLSRWELVATGPSLSRSIAVLNNAIYVGTDDSKLYKYDMSQGVIGTPPPPPGGDTVLPISIINMPANNSTISERTNVSASASDNIGVTKIEVLVDDTLIKSTRSNSLNFRWNTRNITPGPHTLTVQAYDAAGNIGISSVVVTKP